MWRTGRLRSPALVVASALVAVTALAGPVAVPAEPADAAAPAAGRLLDTRPGGRTVDGDGAGGGPIGGGEMVVVPVAGRAGVAADATAAVLNLTAVRPAEAGHAGIVPCGSDRRDTSNLNFVAGSVTAVLAVAPLDTDGNACVYVSGTTDLVVDVSLGLSAGEFAALRDPVRLADSRPAGPTVDGALSGFGPIATGATVEVPVAGRVEPAPGGDPLALSVAAVGARSRGHLTVHSCGAPSPASTLNFGPGDTVANAAFARPDAAGNVCVTVVGTTHVIVDAIGTTGAAELLRAPQRLADTRPGGQAVDGEYAGIGTRPSGGTLDPRVAGRAGVPADAGAAILNVTAVAARAAGHVTAHVGERPRASNVNYGVGGTVANAVVAPLNDDGAACLFTHGATDLVVDVVGWLPMPAEANTAPCPRTDPVFAGHRVVALYGNDVDARLGVLGEQPPAAAADRLARVAAPYEAGDRPVKGAFELIATVATSAPGPGGLYRAPSSAAHVQRYLDVATERGLLLLLDIQPGQGDFLTELQRYERFLRKPNVHVALDPEWNVDAGQIPGQVVGQVSAHEVNAIGDYLAGIVAEHDLPEKILVVHQFQIRMLTDREALRDPEGVAVVIHMDGFGTRSQKLATYAAVDAEPPFYNGFKLFYDEDINMFEPHEVLALDPVPDLITHQ